MYRLLFPEGKTKALTFSYDDNTVHDRRLVEMFNRYGLKATFNLNSGRLDVEGYIHSSEVASLYRGHEVASHGVRHLFPNQISDGERIREYWEDRLALEKLSGQIVTGMAYPFGVHNARVRESLEQMGLHYGRTVVSTGNYFFPDDFLVWDPTCHHQEAIDDPSIADTFLNPPDYMQPDLLYIWGHSYEFAGRDNWADMEALCRKLSGHDEIWYATNREIYFYKKAASQLIESADGSRIENPTGVPVWILKDGTVQLVR